MNANFVEWKFLLLIIFFINKNGSWLKFSVITKFADGVELDTNHVNLNLKLV